MEEKINIAEILKNKPQGTKLYDLLRNIDVELDKVHTTNVGTYIECTSTNDVGSTLWFDYSELGTEESWLEGLRILLPSKDMRYWDKFAWKKGDELVNSSGFKLFFDRWANDDYTRFFGKVNLLENSFSYETEKYTLASKYETLDTLEIEKPEFKGGDIAFADFGNRQYVFIVSGKTNLSEGYYSFIVLNLNSTKALSIGYKTSFFKENLNTIRLATEKEKKQLFSALEKEGKRWDSEHKMIVDLPKNCEFKPFDKVLVRQLETEEWRANIFSHTDKTDKYLDYVCVNGRWEFCIPYEGNESLLGTTKDVEG